MSDDVATTVAPTPAPTTDAPAQTQAATPAPANESLPQMDDSLAKKLHLLSKREKEVMAKRKEIEESSSKYKPYEELKATAKKNPIAILEHFGVSYDELTDFIIQGNDPENQRYSELQNQINSLKQEKEAEAQAARAAKEENATNTFKATIASAIDAEKHEFCAAHGDAAIDMAYSLIETYWTENQKMLEVGTALDWIEEHLEEQVAPLLALNKIKSRFSPKQEAAPMGDAPIGANSPNVGKQQQVQPARTSGQTITNQMSTSSVQSATDDSEQARLSRAASLLRRK
jgi:hypothetical protein